MTVYELKKRIENLYELSGQYLCIYKIDENENWEEAFKNSEYDFTDEEISTLKKIIKKEGEEREDIEIFIEDFFKLLCEENNCCLEVWKNEHIFESCSYDLFILSFAIRDKSNNELIYSLHNKYERF